MFKSYLPQTSRHDYPRVVAPLSIYPPFVYEFQKKAPSILDRTQALQPTKEATVS